MTPFNRIEAWARNVLFLKGIPPVPKGSRVVRFLDGSEWEVLESGYSGLGSSIKLTFDKECPIQAGDQIEILPPAVAREVA